MSKNESIFLDECGFTGADLLNGQQPAFVLATLNLTEEVCLGIKDTFFSAVKAAELKHSALRRRPSQQAMVADFISHIASNPRSYKLSVTDKQFALVTKMVDLVAESAAHADDVDLYAGGGNVVLANLMYYGLPAFGGRRFFRELLTRFQAMMRKRTLREYRRFFALIDNRTSPTELDDLLMFLRAGQTNLGPRLLDQSPDCLDLALSNTLCLMGAWRAQNDGRIVLIHDESGNFAKQGRIWDAVVDPHLPKRDFIINDIPCRFPVAVSETRMRPSHDHAGLQLTDVLAGSVAYFLRFASSQDEYAAKLSPAIGQLQVDHCIRSAKPEETQDLNPSSSHPELIDYLSAAIQRNPPP